jgi:hypothetical protein
MHKLIAVALLGLAGAGSAFAAAPTTQIFQQRTADGSLLLTDHPAAGAKTERSWQIEREDPAAARQRAIDVKAEANLVTERIQRMLDQQQRANDDTQRTRLAMLQYDRDRLALDAQDGISYGGGGGWAVPFRASRFIGPRIGEPPAFDPIAPRDLNGRRAGGHGRPSGSGSPGNHSR